MVKKQLSDEQLDALMRMLVNESTADEALLSEIADSPATWWGVSRKINEQKAEKLSAWPPVGKVLRWLMAGGVVTAAAVLILSLFVFRPATIHDENGTAAVDSHESWMTQTAPETVNLGKDPISDDTKIDKNIIVPEAKPAKNMAKPVTRQIAVKTPINKNTVVKSSEVAKANKKEEIKTEFIALSYARDPESGQIVRVKVPSSMMVSLGLVTSVKKPTDMVDAEVLVGDDGLTRAIRFIR